MKKIFLLLSFLWAAQSIHAQDLPPAKPSGVKAAQIGLQNKIKVEWSAANPSDSLTGYKVYYSKNGTSATDSVRLGKVITVDLINLSLDTAYNVHVKAFRVPTLKASAPDTLYSDASSSLRVVVATLVKPSISIEASLITHNSFSLKITDPNKYETGFEVETEENSNVKTVTISKSGTSITEVISSLKANTSYKIKVRAVINSEKGPWSDVATVKTKIDFPPNAVLKTEGNCPYAAGLNWDFSERANEVAKILIWRSLSHDTGFEVIADLPYSQRNYVDNNALPGIRYYYNVVSENSTGNSFSNTAFTDVQPYRAPSIPVDVQSLQEDKSTTHLTVTWRRGAEDGVCKTNILANTQLAVKINGGDLKTLANLPNWTNIFKIDNLKPKDQVQIFLRTESDKGIFSEWTSIQDATFGPPSAPSNLIWVLIKDHWGKHNIVLEWKDTANELDNYFEIEKSLDGVNFTQFTITNNKFTKITDTEVKEGFNYYYRVRSGNWAGTSSYTQILGPLHVPFTSKPNAPYGINLTRNGNGVDITWRDDSIQEENYVVEKSNDDGATFNLIATLAKDVTKYRDENITEGRTYHYRVKAVNPLGSSAYSEAEKISIAANPSSVVFNITVYPNPVMETLNIKGEGVDQSKNYTLRLFDQNNRLIVDKQIRFNADSSSAVSAGSLVPGVYNMTLSNGSELLSKKLVKL